MDLKQYFLLDPQITFLNHGSFGATPRPVFESYQRWQMELERQPVEFLGRRFAGLMQSARAALADFAGTTENNIVYVTNVTVGLNVVARSLKLGPGDEVLTSDHEYGALDRTWRFLSTESGFTYRACHIPLPLTTSGAFVDALWESVTPHTRVIFLSQITSPSAIIFPVAEVCARARREGIITVIDGAHTAGQIPLKLDELGADFWSGNLHKWLMAPKGAGFLFARPDMQHLLKPLIVSWGYQSETPGPSVFIDQQEWTGTRDISAFLSVPDAIQFQEEHAWETVRESCFELANYAREGIESITGLPSLHISGARTFRQMVAVRLPDAVDMPVLKSRLYDIYKVEVPLTSWNGNKLLRISVQGYNTKQDIHTLLNALKLELAGL